MRKIGSKKDIPTWRLIRTTASREVPTKDGQTRWTRARKTIMAEGAQAPDAETAMKRYAKKFAMLTEGEDGVRYTWRVEEER